MSDLDLPIDYYPEQPEDAAQESTASSAPLLSVIVVSADSGEVLRECVARVLACTMPLELILVDNGSRDGIPQRIARARENDPRFHALFQHNNLGFGPAVNRGVAKATGKAVLMLNPDCLVIEADLQRMLDILYSEPKIGVLGAVVCDEHGRPDRASFRRDPLLSRALGRLFGFGRGVNMGREIPHELVEAEAVSGAIMLMPHRVFDWVRGFDEDYFLHFEDLDLCRRVRNDGWRVMLAGDVRVMHAKGTSSRHRPIFVSYHKHRGMWRWFRKFDPYGHTVLLSRLVWLGIWAHFLLRVPGQWLRAKFRRRA